MSTGSCNRPNRFRRGKDDTVESYTYGTARRRYCYRTTGKKNDNDLVVDVDEEVFEMNNGCICCTVRGDLIES